MKEAVTDLDRAMAAADELAMRLKVAVRGWSESLNAVEQHVFPLFPAAAKDSSDDWRQLCLSLDLNALDDVLRAGPRLVERTLLNYAMAARELQRGEIDSLQEILSVLAEAAQGVRERNAIYGARFEELGASLGELANETDPDQMRAGLAREAASLREAVAIMTRETAAAAATMEEDLTGFRRRLAEAEAAAMTDPLTGLANRRALEMQLQDRIVSGVSFCALLFDMDSFKGINDRFGHDCGDQVLKLFARILNEQVRPGDVVARWGGDEFFVIFDCELKDALKRAQQIAARLSTRYDVYADGKSVALPIRASAGVVEHRPGESAADLFRRADQAMYAAKPKTARP
jgi:diguanylate cyclase